MRMQIYQINIVINFDFRNKPMQKVHFYFHDRSYALKDRKKLKRTIDLIFEKEKRTLQKIDFIFCSDDYLIDINRKFLNHDYYTDIITFDLSTRKNQIEGEIYISIDRIKENARTIKTSIRNELCRVVFHGALHLCGYSDKTEKEINLMRKAEDKYLRSLLK